MKVEANAARATQRSRRPSVGGGPAGVVGAGAVAAACAPVRRSTTAQAMTRTTNPTYPHDHSRNWSSSVSRGSTSVG